MRIKIVETEEIIEANSYCELLSEINEKLDTNYSNINDIEGFVPNPNSGCEGATPEDVNCCLIIQFLIGQGIISIQN